MTPINPSAPSPGQKGSVPITILLGIASPGTLSGDRATAIVKGPALSPIATSAATAPATATPAYAALRPFIAEMWSAINVVASRNPSVSSANARMSGLTLSLREHAFERALNRASAKPCRRERTGHKMHTAIPVAANRLPLRQSWRALGSSDTGPSGIVTDLSD